MSDTIPAALRAAFAQKKLIPLVGAGVSMSLRNKAGKCPFPSWAGLLQGAAERLRSEGKPEYADGIAAMLPLKKFKQAADLAKEGLTGSLWNQFFKDQFTIQSEDIDPATLALPQAIWTLGPRVITLNYDRVMRIACPRAHDVRELDNTTKGELAELQRLSDTVPSVWHLHGRLDNLEKIIFTSDRYDRLYLERDPDYQAALETLRALSGTCHLLFVGCSLDDAELLAQLGREHDIFAGNTGPHYALVRESERAAVAAKLVGLPVDLIGFDGFGQPLLDKIASITGAGGTSAPASAPTHAGSASAPAHTGIAHTPAGSAPTHAGGASAPAHAPVTPAPRAPRIAILRANPIGSGAEDAPYQDLMAEFKKLKCQVSLHPLTVAKLNELDEVDYVFILSRLIKNRIVIEDEFLASRSHSLMELEQNIGCTQVRGVCFFLSNLADSSAVPADALAGLMLPTLIVPRQDKTQAASFCFQLFKKVDPKWLNQQVGANLMAFQMTVLKGESKWEEKRTALPTLIDAKSARGYIGRANDLQMLCREILHLANSHEVLVLKGSGGIGKTATIKKIAVAMAARSLFGGGIDFIDCEFITDYSTFANKAVASFNLENALDLTGQLRTRFGKEDKLIILDNLETMLILPEIERKPMLDLIDLLADHASVVVTTREIPPLSALREITLRPFTSEEGYTLFMQTLGVRKLVGADADVMAEFIRIEIVERLLDNNPLAIRLVASNVPSGKSMADLQQELDQNIFGKALDAEYANYTEFDRLASGNIERKKSLFASIYFSYRYLGDDAQRTFELLSLFPDGISLHDLQQVAQQRRSEARQGQRGGGTAPEWRINDVVIKQLEDKSITQVDNGVIKLQSIVGKFAEYQLNRRDLTEQAQQRRHALAFHIGLAQYLYGLLVPQRYKAAQQFSQSRGNFLKSLASFELAGLPPELLLDYLDNLSGLASHTSANAILAQAMVHQTEYFSGATELRNGFVVLLLHNQYYAGEFASALARLQALLPVGTLAQWVPDTLLDRMMLRMASDIYAMEGEILLEAQLASKFQWTYGGRYPDVLLRLGHIAPSLLTLCQSRFFTLETYYQHGSLRTEQVATYLTQVYEKDHLELMQTHYLQAKLAWQQAAQPGVAHAAVQAVLSPEQIHKLVSINPFTRGLQHIMLALAEPDASVQAEQFECGIELLEHIKYYYVEALLLYATCLQQHGQLARYQQIHEQGLALARHHHYRRLQYQFEVLAGKTGPWRDGDYPLPEGLELEGYVNWLIKDRQKRR